jgi:RNA recognition motif-containing protein
MFTIDLNGNQFKNKDIRMQIYVVNLPKKTNEENLKKMFESFGVVIAIKIFKDHLKNKSRKFGFVDMSSRIEAQSAIDNLDGKKLKGKTLSVSKVRQNKEDSEEI